MMDRTCAFMTGMSFGAGLMYILDPQTGGRRRALARDKMVRMAHEAQDAADVVRKDAWNRAQGLAAGDWSVLAGGKRALEHPWQGGWSPTARTFMGLLGGGLFLYGLTRSAPEACFLGCAGLALAAEGATNARLDDLADIPKAAAGLAARAQAAVNFGQGEQGGRTNSPTPATAGA